MATIESPPSPRLGDHGAPCPLCESPLASDQRYCLNCGSRRGDPRIPIDEAVAFGTSSPTTAASPLPNGPTTALSPPIEHRSLTPLAAVLAVSTVVVAMGIGVVLGRGGDSKTVAAAAPQVITIGAAGAGDTAEKVGAKAFTSSWPAAKSGFTVELVALPKSSTNPTAVAAAKRSATTKGAPNVGALDSTKYASLPAGSYVVYSGVFETKAGAANALKKLKSKFPAAKVVLVSTKATPKSAVTPKSSAPDPKTVDQGQLNKLQNATPEEYQKQSKKLPSEIGTQGTPPPTDNKPAGGGGGATEIG